MHESFLLVKDFLLTGFSRFPERRLTFLFEFGRKIASVLVNGMLLVDKKIHRKPFFDCLGGVPWRITR